jgi:hypothetical protein
LELREDPYGLHVWSRFAKTQTADEIATLMQGGFIDQMSFACNIGADEWTQDSDGNITRTIFSVDGLFDVTICAQGAFPQTDAQLVASMNDAGTVLASAKEAGRIMTAGVSGSHKVVITGDSTGMTATPDLVASRGETGEDIAPSEGVTAVADDRRAERLAALQEQADARFAQHADTQV